MATITSAQSGPFDVGSTWVGGVVPADGDDFRISLGHIVAVTGDSRPTNGYHNSYVYGKLHLQGSGCMLRMNGVLYIDSLNSNTYFTEGASSAPYFRMDPGSILEIKGTDAENHALWVNPEQRITVEILGTNPNPETTIAADISASGSPGPISFSDASKFAPGDWINVYMPERTGRGWNYYRSDESFWIHDVDNNDVYFKQFVGPEATIIAVQDNKIVVDDASVFRAGYHLIFGTGNNRNVRTISDLAYGSNTITLDSNVSGSVIGEKVYQTSVDKTHLSGDKVLRIAAVTTANASVGSSSIVVNNTNGFNVGDLILIQPNSDSYSEVGIWDFICDYTITAIDTGTKTISFTNGYTSTTQTTLQKVTNAGALVVNITRDTKIKAPEGTNYGNSGERSYIYFQGGDNYYRRFKIKNCLINLGTDGDGNNYSSIGMRGASSHELTSNGQYVSEFDGNVIYPVYRGTNTTGYQFEQHYLVRRNNVHYNNAGSVQDYGYAMSHFATIGMRFAGAPFNMSNFYEPRGEIAYNYVSCSNGTPFNFQQCTDTKNLIHHNIAKNCVGTMYFAYSAHNYMCFRNYFDRYIYPPGSERSGQINHVDSYFGNKWDVTNPNGAGSLYSTSLNMAPGNYYHIERTSAHMRLSSSLCDNFKYNGLRVWNNTTLRLWDNTEQAWKVFPDRDYTGNCGLANDIFLPANTTMHVKSQVKLISPNTNYPYLRVASGLDYDKGATFSLSAATLSHSDPRVTKIAGFENGIRFTSASLTGYETKINTIGPFKFDTYVNASVFVSNGSAGNAFVGWYEKDMEIILTSPVNVPNASQMTHFLTTKKPVRYKQTADETQTIWGG